MLSFLLLGLVGIGAAAFMVDGTDASPPPEEEEMEDLPPQDGGGDLLDDPIKDEEPPYTFADGTLTATEGDDDFSGDLPGSNGTIVDLLGGNDTFINASFNEWVVNGGDGNDPLESTSAMTKL
jgi:hypothetical protein